MRLLVKVHEEVTGLLGGPFTGGMQGAAEDADAPGCVLDYGQDVGLGAVGQVDGEESRARMASAWERRNCDQVSPLCRRPGSMPLALRISQTVDAATLTPRPASSP